MSGPTDPNPSEPRALRLLACRAEAVQAVSIDERLYVPEQLDRALKLKRGAMRKMAEAGQVPHIKLPDGEIRFDRAAVEAWLGRRFVRENLS